MVYDDTREAMRLTIVCPWTLPSIGGTQTLVHRVASRLAEGAGYQVSVVSARLPSHRTGMAGTTDAGGPYDVVRLPLVPALLSCEHVATGECQQYWLEGGLSAISETDPEAILYTPHCTSFAYQALIASRQLAVPFILWPAIHLDRAGDVSKEAASFYAAADCIIANSEMERAWLTSTAQVNPSRVHVLGCGITLADIKPEPCTYRPDHGITQLLSVGQLRPHKRFADQAQALSVLKHEFGAMARLAIAGAGSEDEEEVLKLIRGSAAPASVVVLRNATTAELKALWSSSNMFLFTSASESFGIVVLEAIARAVYPVVYPHAVYSQIVKDAKYGSICRSASPDSLAQTVNCLLRSKKYLCARSAATLDWLYARRWEVITAQLAAILRRVLRN